jgi:CBS domain-containing protein
MKAADVMVTEVITIGPQASIRELIRLLIGHRISAVPVVDQWGRLLGIVSEADLMRRVEVGTEHHRSRWSELLMDDRTRATEYLKSHSRRVADIMTREVVTAAPTTPLGDIADLLERNGIKRVPIMHKGKIVGIVARANLIQKLASLIEQEPAPDSTDDAELREKVIARLEDEAWKPLLLTVSVRDGNVDVWGYVESEAEKNAVRVTAELTPGVRAVHDQLIVRRIVSRM